MFKLSKRGDLARVFFFLNHRGQRLWRDKIPVWAWNTPGWSADLGLWVLTFCSSSSKSENNKQLQISITIDDVDYVNYAHIIYPIYTADVKHVIPLYPRADTDSLHRFH